MAERASAAPGPGWTLLGAAAVVPAFLAAALSVGAQVVMRTGTGLVGGVVGGLALTVALGAWAMRGNWRFRRPDAAESTSLALLLAMLAVLWDRAAFRAITIPWLYGVDQAHHGALITMIAFDDRLPGTDARIAGLANYPTGSHVIAAAVGRSLRLTPLTAMWVTALGAMAVTMLLLVWITRCALEERLGALSWLGAGVPVVVWLAGWRVGLGLVTADFFFAQAVSLVFVVAGVGVCVCVAARGGALRLLPVAALFAVAALWSYPQQGLVVPVAMALSLRVPGRRRLLRLVRAHVAATSGAALVVLGALGAAVLIARRSAYLSVGAIAGVGEGITAPLSLRSIGGPFVAVLGAYALAELLGSTLRGDRPSRVLLGAAAVPASLAAVLALLRVSWIAGISVTQYRIVKNIYTAFPLVAIAIGVAVAIAASALASRFVADPASTGRRLGALGVGLGLICALSIAVRPPHLATMSTPLVDRGAYELAIRPHPGIAPDDIGVVDDGIGPYILWWMGIRRPLPADVTKYPEVPRSARWAAWPDANPEHYLLVGASQAADFEHRPGVQVIARHRGAVLLHRVDR